MLTCIACSKQLNGNGSLQQNDEDNAAGTPSTKQAVKALTAQVLLVVQSTCLDSEKMWENWFEFYCFLTECFPLFDLSFMWVLSVFGKMWKMNRSKKTQLVFLMVYFYYL